ncbi:hypothetical protein FTO70_07045 [Methanosarcina sp. KYL-1]|uniref:hypothetical protein n=1 Tax=Methanosarcina sp. KYL-1 TaxID=2602068 RepID=UPI002100AD13|nr:hypothetical protein [Methanosarcina sp. KYL-1]MCQ1535446.1 hypothetical protein [Methanosarcina sp. KYL-1]
MQGFVSRDSIAADESAVFGLPFRFSVAGILFALLLLLSSVSISDFLDGAKEREALAEISKLTEAAEQLSLRGEGSKVTLEFRVPEGTAVGFGALPGKEGQWPEDANNYYVSIEGRISSYSAGASFSNADLRGPVFFGSGLHRLVLSTGIEPVSGRLFVLVSDSGDPEGL